MGWRGSDYREMGEMKVGELGKKSGGDRRERSVSACANGKALKYYLQMFMAYEIHANACTKCTFIMYMRCCNYAIYRRCPEHVT